VSGLTVESLLGHRNPTGLVLIAAVALALDAVDGWVARRTGTATPLGARMDMEADAFLILVLSVAATRVLGWWVLAIGAFRYAFLAATWVAPWLGGAVPPRFSRKAVAAIQGVVLTVVAADLLPREDSAAVVVLALGLLVWSFGTQVTELWPHREPRLGRTSARDPVVRALE
jgi:phosphatidylglycerophosphate synthase